MQDKHKVTLYLPPDLHRQLKIRSAVELEPMSTIAERAIDFYLTHSEVVDEVEAAHGQAHRVYSCPECASSLILREGEMAALSGQASVLIEDEASVDRLPKGSPDQRGEGELVPC